MNHTGIFVGTFYSFTIGRDAIVRRALPLFDRLVIGVVGDNVNKPAGGVHCIQRVPKKPEMNINIIGKRIVLA